jgi:hypothetical protein
MMMTTEEEDREDEVGSMDTTRDEIIVEPSDSERIYNFSDLKYQQIMATLNL